MTATPIRHPAVAGRFYPDNPESLRGEVRTYLSQAPPNKPVHAIGCLVPHAGYLYSGHVAGAVFAALQIPKLCIVMCPNHTGWGRPLAIMSEGAWQTPLGTVSIAHELAASLKRCSPILEEDSLAHRNEHAAEVELPFLQLRQPNVSFVPIAIGTRQFEVLEQLGTGMADVIAALKTSVLIIASSDMNHYESDAITRVKDHAALRPILRLDPRSLYDVVVRQNVSMCGFGPAIVLLIAAKKLGAKSAELIKYATSGDVSGDRDAVVGYAGVIVPSPSPSA